MQHWLHFSSTPCCRYFYRCCSLVLCVALTNIKSASSQEVKFFGALGPYHPWRSSLCPRLSPQLIPRAAPPLYTFSSILYPNRQGRLGTAIGPVGGPPYAPLGRSIAMIWHHDFSIEKNPYVLRTQSDSILGLWDPVGRDRRGARYGDFGSHDDNGYFQYCIIMSREIFYYYISLAGYQDIQ